MWMLWLLVTVLTAAATAYVAERKGQNGTLWFMVGLIAPVFGLVVAVIALRPAGHAAEGVPTAEEAARGNPVARLLASHPGLSAHAVAERIGGSEREVLEHLAALRSLGFAARDDGGRWRLTVGGDDALAG